MIQPPHMCRILTRRLNYFNPIQVFAFADFVTALIYSNAVLYRTFYRTGYVLVWPLKMSFFMCE
jgi:hypothetical protein